VFLTNNTTLPATTIAELYKSRWQVELFFKWIKQHLRIKRFIGNSENAVKTQIWCAVDTYVLIAIVKKELQIDASLYTLLQILSVSVFEKTQLQQAFAACNYIPEQTNLDNQLSDPRQSRGFIRRAPQRRPHTVSRPWRLHAQFHLVLTFILLFLIPYVGSDHFFIQPYRSDKVASGPEDFSGEVPCPTSEPAGYRYRAFALDVAHYVGHRILRRYAQTHVHVIRHQVPFYYFRFFVLRQFPEYLSQVPSQTSKDRFLPSLRDKYHMVFAIPPRMRKTLVLPHGFLLLSWSRVEDSC